MTHHVVVVGKVTRWVREQRGPYLSFDEAKVARDELRKMFRGLPAELSLGGERSLADQHDFEIISTGDQGIGQERPW